MLRSRAHGHKSSLSCPSLSMGWDERDGRVVGVIFWILGVLDFTMLYYAMLCCAVYFCLGDVTCRSMARGFN